MTTKTSGCVKLIYEFPNNRRLTAYVSELHEGSAMSEVIRIYSSLYGQPRILQPE